MVGVAGHADAGAKFDSQFGETLRSIAGTEFSFSSVRIPGKCFFEPAHSTTDLNSAGNETGAGAPACHGTPNSYTANNAG